MAGLLLGVTLIYWSLGLLSILSINNTLLGLLALITGIAWVLISVGVALPVVPTRRRAE